jgi:hypothetical protein
MEGVYYSPSYAPTGPYTPALPEIQALPAQSGSPGSKIPFLFLTTVILIGLVLIFASDKKPKKKKASSSVRPRRSAKRVKKVQS